MNRAYPASTSVSATVKSAYFQTALRKRLSE
jgi:hypothetical protein